MTAPPPPDWQEYLAAAQALDALRRAQVSAAAVATRTISTARADLATVRARLAAQHSLLASEAARLGLPAPQLEPSPDEQAAAATAVPGPEAVPEALRQCQELVAAADSQLVRATRARRWWPRRRHHPPRRS